MVFNFIEVKKIESFNLKNPYLIIGLPGAGLIGSIAATYLSSEKDFEMVGYFESDKLAPVASLHNYKPLPPVRVLASKEKNMVVFLSEASIPLSLTLPLSNFIYDLAKKVNAKLIISLGGMAKPTLKKRKIYLICSSDKVFKLLKGLNLGERIKEGATTGVSALLLTKCAYTNFPMISLLVETGSEISDPKASSIALKSISKITDKFISTTKLEKEARDYEKSLELEISIEDDSMYR